MATYAIIGQTNGWIAQRDSRRFNGKTYVTIASGLTQKEAQKKMLDMLNEDYDTGYQNWGLVRCNYPTESSSFCDGTRSYEYDSRRYSIEEES